MELVFGLGLAVVAVIVAVVAVGFQMEEKAVVRSSLRRLEGYDIQDTRDKELLNPLAARAFAPTFKRVVDFGRRRTPVGYIETIRRKQTQAGRPEADAVDRFLVLKIVCLLFIPVAIWIVYFGLGLDGSNALLLSGLFVLALILVPDARLNREVEARTKKMRIALPEILDLLVISVEAGLGFEQALDRVIDAVPGPLTDEFNRMLGEVRAGSSRSQAMRALDQRVDVAEVRSFIMAMLQADTFGVSIGKVLRNQADEMRVKRRQLAQEEAQKVPVKMLIPMVFCIFPALFVVVLGPAVLDILDAF